MYTKSIYYIINISNITNMNKKAILFGVLAFAVVLTAGVASAQFVGNSNVYSLSALGYGYYTGYGYGYNAATNWGVGENKTGYGYGYGLQFAIADYLYGVILHRPADLNGLLYYSGKTTGQTIADLYASAEHKPIAVQDAYNYVLGRDADAGGLTYYTGKMNAGWTIEQVKADMMTSAEFVNQIIAGAEGMYGTTAVDGSGAILTSNKK